MKRSLIPAFSCAAVLVFSCAAPRTVTQTGRVTPKKNVRVGMDISGNISTATTGALFGSLQSAVDSVTALDSVKISPNTQDMAKALLAWSIDPLAMGTGFYARYGLVDRVDIGFKSAPGVKVYDAMYQFLGEADGGKSNSLWYASIGIQYSSQDYTLPSYFGDLQELLGYEMARKDILVPLLVSREFGPGEKYGAVTAGLGYNYTMLKYKYEPTLVYKLVASQYEKIADVPQDEQGYSSFGLLFNLKAGYKYAYGLISLGIFYQDYGEFNLLDGETASLSGLTVIPNFGLQFGFGFD